VPGIERDKGLITLGADLDSGVGAVRRKAVDPEGAHSSIKARFSLGERLPISSNALSATTSNNQKELIKLWQKL
jgi:hypothetical protein